MTFINDNGDQLDIIDDFAMSKRSISLFSGDILGDTSINFTVDNNSPNRKTLAYDGPQMINQVAATKQAFNRVKNGNVIDRGYIVIQAEYQDHLECYYVSGNSNWIQILDIDVKELDYTGVLSSRNYLTKMNDASVNASTGKTYGIVFPLADWWSDYQRGLSVYNSTSIFYGGSFFPPGTTAETIIPELYSNPIFDFYPCFYVSSILDEINAQLGIKISGTLLQDQLFKTLIITPSDGLIKRANLFSSVVLNGNSQVLGAGSNRYTSFTEVSDNDNLFSSGRFTADAPCTIKTIINIVAFTGTPLISLFKNGVSSGTLLNTTVTLGYTYINYINVLPGDYVDIIITGATTIRLNWSIDCQSFVSYDNYVLPSDFLPKLKCVDLIKTLINLFGCSSYFDDFSKTLTLNIIENYKKEDAEDWSDYYISHRSEYTVSTSKHNFINVNNLSLDKKIAAYNNINTTKFGSGDIVTSNTLSENNVAIDLPFASAFFDMESDNSYQARVPLVQLSDSSSKIAFTAIADLGSGLSSFTISAGDISFARGEYVRVINSSGTDLGLFRLPSAGSPTVVVIYLPFYGTDTGYIIKQTIRYNSPGFCLLTNSTINCSDLYPGYSNFGWIDPFSGTDNRKSTNDYAYFTKLKTGLTIDNIKGNISIDNPNINGYSDPSVKNLYLNKISNFFKNPFVRMQMTLPESVYQSYKFNKFVYVKSEKLIGYFFPSTIENYQDASTPVEVNVYMS